MGYIKQIEKAAKLYIKGLLQDKEMFIYIELLDYSVRSLWRFPVEVLTESLAASEKLKSYHLLAILENLRKNKMIDFNNYGKTLSFTIY